MTRNRMGTVAVVDDDPALLASLRFLLEVTGHQVAVYESAAAFLEDCDLSPACLILDHQMPHMTGLELAARLLADDPTVRILLITGLVSPTILDRAVQLGVRKMLEKPPDEGDLLRFVDGDS